MEQGNFKDYLLKKVFDYQHQQDAARAELLKAGYSMLARENGFDVTRFRHLMLSFLNDGRCVTKEDFLEALKDRLEALPAQYLAACEVSKVYAEGVFYDFRFLVRELYFLGVLKFGFYSQTLTALDKAVDCFLFGNSEDCAS